MKDKLIATAYHEAGHAIIGLYFGLQFEYVTIVECDEYLGRVMFSFDVSRFMKILDGTLDEILENEEIEKIVEEYLIMSLSGYTTELKFGIDNSEGASTDFDSCKDISLRHCGDGESATEFLDICFSKSKYLVNENWDKIITLAHKLLEKNTLLEREVIDLFTDEN
jgi:ATP-dependent Zn protease